MFICAIYAGNLGSDKETCSLLSAYDHVAGCIWEQLVGVSQLPGGGQKIAETIVEQGRRLRVKEFAGSATDNAPDALKKFVSEMKKKFPGFVGAGCTLHVLNLVLMNSYHSTLGKRRWVSMVHYSASALWSTT